MAGTGAVDSGDPLTHDAAMNASEWKDAGQATGMFILGALMVWNKWQQGKTAKTVEVIHALTNSSMGLQKKALADVSAAKAAITKDPEDIKASEAAMADYLDHVKKQSTADTKS